MKISCLGLFLGLLVALLSGCGGGEAQESAATSSAKAEEAQQRPQKLKAFDMTLEGYPDAENAGVLMADRSGYFAEAGLNVDVLHPVDSDNVPEYVATGGDLFGLLPQPQVVMAREEGMPLVAVGRLVGKPTFALIWSNKSRIHGPADLKGMTIAINGFSFEERFLEALLKQVGLSSDDVKVKSVNYGLVPALVKGRADAILGSGNIEGLELEALGVRPVVTPLQKFGFPVYEELVVVTRRSQLAGNPPWIHRFMAAVARGNAAAVEDPEAAAAAIAVAREELELPAANPELVQAKVEATLPLLAGTAQMSTNGGAGLAEWMHEQGLIKQELPAAALLTNRFAGS